jgi:hypothetical protein
MSLKSKLTKLAYENPGMREDILPLLRAASKETWIVKNQVRSLDETVDEIDASCARAGLQTKSFEGKNRSRHITVEGSPAAIKKVFNSYKTKVTKAKEASGVKTPLEEALWKAWDNYQGIDKVSRYSSLEKLIEGIGLTATTADEYIPEQDKLGELTLKLNKKLERESKSWRTSYNLSREGKIALDSKRLGRPLKTFLSTMGKIEQCLIKLKATTKDDLFTWEVKRGLEALQTTVQSFELVQRQARAGSSAKLAFGKTVKPGDTWESENIRIIRGASTLKLMDITYAGKRGKKVPWIHVELTSHYDGDKSERKEWYDRITQNWTAFYADSFKGAVNYIGDLQDSFPKDIRISNGTLRAIDVAPAGFKPIKLVTKNLTLRSDYEDFSVLNNLDKSNYETCVPAARGNRKDVHGFYRWVQENSNAIKRMDFADLCDALRKEGIRYTKYCMD